MKTLLLSLLIASSALAGEEPKEPLAAPTLPIPEKFSFLDASSVSTFAFYDSGNEDFGAGIRFSFDINPTVSINLDYQSPNYELEDSDIAADSSVSIHFNYPVKNLPVPADVYAITGTGISSFDDPDIQALIGFGVSVDVNESMAAFFEYQFSSSESTSLARLGVTLSF